MRRVCYFLRRGGGAGGRPEGRGGPSCGAGGASAGRRGGWCRGAAGRPAGAKGCAYVSNSINFALAIGSASPFDLDMALVLYTPFSAQYKFGFVILEDDTFVLFAKYWVVPK